MIMKNLIGKQDVVRVLVESGTGLEARDEVVPYTLHPPP
jgi:hypothetical protein